MWWFTLHLCSCSLPLPSCLSTYMASHGLSWMAKSTGWSKALDSQWMAKSTRWPNALDGGSWWLFCGQCWSLCWLDLLGQNLVGSTLTFTLCFADHWSHKYELHTRLDALQVRSFIIALISTAQMSKNQVASSSNPRVEVVTGVCRVDWRLRQWDQVR